MLIVIISFRIKSFTGMEFGGSRFPLLSSFDNNSGWTLTTPERTEEAQSSVMNMTTDNTSTTTTITKRGRGRKSNKIVIVPPDEESRGRTSASSWEAAGADGKVHTTDDNGGNVGMLPSPELEQLAMHMLQSTIDGYQVHMPAADKYKFTSLISDGVLMPLFVLLFPIADNKLHFSFVILFNIQGDVIVCKAFLPFDDAKLLMQAVESSIQNKWVQDTLLVYGGTWLEPRIKVYFGDRPYSYHGVYMKVCRACIL